MDLEAEDQPQPDEPRVPADEGYQRLAGHNDANPPLQNDGRYNKLHICLIILIAAMFAVFLAMVLSFGVVLSIFLSHVSSAAQTLSCHQDTTNCHFLKNHTIETEASCYTPPLSTNAKASLVTNS